MPGYRLAVSPEEHRSKTMGLAPAELSAAPDPHQLLRKRLREEMEALRGILRKAELVVRKAAVKGRAAPRRGKDGHFLAAAVRLKAMEADQITCDKKRKTMSPVETIMPGIMEADRTQGSMNICRSISRSSPRELEEGEFTVEDCGATTDTCGGDAPAVVASKGLGSAATRILEDGEMTEEHGIICGDAGHATTAKTAESPSNSSSSGSSSSSDGSSSGSSCSDSSNSDSSDSDSDPECVTSNVAPAVLPIPKADACAIAMPAKGLCSPPRILKDEEMAEEEVDICGDMGPIATEKFVETANSPSSSSSSSGSSSSSTSRSSGSSSSDSSDSDSGDSGSDDECETSNPAPVVPPKTDASLMTMPHKVPNPIAEDESLLEDGEIEEEHE